ncbi:MAG: hypothetical protein IJJ96_01285 [Bacteroidales bacterium]|nr:hypothetical protein [Bacteroidales bacterium]
MKFFKSLFTIAVTSALLFSISANSQNRKQQYQNPEFVRLLHEDITRAGCNTNRYEFGPIHDTPAPKGYKPYYISHYGRHGSRSNWGGSQYESLIKILKAAKKDDLLTASGDSLLQEVLVVNQIHNGMDGRLTRVVADEHALLADRMYHRYKKVFNRKGTTIRAISSTVPRCIVSMTAATSRLKAINPDFDIRWDCGETYQKYMATGPTDKIWKIVNKTTSAIDAEYVPDTAQVMNRLFTNPAAAMKHVKDVVTLEKYIFEAGVVTDAFEVKPILRFLPFDAVYKWFELTNLNLYLGQCNSVEAGALRMPIAEPLVNDIVTRADEALSSGTVAADLRYGHDYDALALCSYLGFEGVGDHLTADQARRQWFGPWNVPFAVNIQMVFYKNKKGDVLVKFLHNEKETLLRGLDPVEGPYYSWQTVKDNIKGYLR